MQCVMCVDGLADTCVHITSLMSRDVQESQLAPKEFKRQLSDMDVQGIVVYCSPFAEQTQSWLELITGEMLDAMWGAMSVDGEMERKRKLV